MATLKIWNGRGHYKLNEYHLFVAAYSVKQAAELVGKACGLDFPISLSEIRVYYHKDCWGNSMIGITPEEPCVYALKDNDYINKPKRIV